MGRLKKSKVEKSPFKLRQRQLADGRISLFIDHIHGGKHSYEFLKLYLLPETSEKIRRENNRTARLADEILRKRIEEYVEKEADRIGERDLAETPLSEFINILIAEKKRKNNRTNQFVTVKGNLQQFRPDTRMCDIDKRYCIDYADWLRHTCVSRLGKPLAPQTTFNYFWHLGIILSNAYRMGYIRQNPWCLLDSSDKIREPERQHRFLTLDEVRILEETPYHHELVKRAFLFSCFCGLRISDVLNIKWSDIYSNNGLTYVSIIMKKTSRPISIPLTAKALHWLPEKNDESPKIFGGLPSETQINKHLKKWVSEAGISGNIHYHVSRHTYGTMLMTAGVDLYTASKLMGHSDIRATQVYSKIIDKKKQEAVSLIDDVF